ncbi:MAG: AmmeMemoRadiSam system protein B, partial [Sulfurimonadaceae bacterium]|jgi:AmmeMemoRadiSam system protein B|nr:AmmeMemoRadiSam system protein B [Sulfurimonadaceae bacterium]
MQREMSVCGTFYPAREIELERYFEHFEEFLKEEQKSLPTKDIKALIVPHAGYIYSGYSAYIAYKTLVNTKLKNLLILGPSHRTYLNGVSLCSASSYETPFGTIAQSQELYQTLQNKYGMSQTITHAEHSTEVQFPMIKHLLPDVKIVEIIYGDTTPTTLSEIIDFALSLPETGVIISTDLSHFYTLEEANKLDNRCIKAVANLDTSTLHNGCEACGILGLEAMMLSAKIDHLKPHILD